MASLSLRQIYKIYQGNVQAVSDFNLEIEDKEFIVFVGPSGCGKSTTLRMIAGLEEITAGELYIDDKLVNDVEPKDRDIAMVFQNYALYPHMTVYDNMAFGLRLRKKPAAEIDQKVKEAAKILGIEKFLTRKPKALSGGQRQRVALGRAIVREPKVFLLDEPLSNLDAKLRVQMRTEITKLHNKLATTFIYVTHDQTEAMTMGTRIVVMKDGIMQQVDTPRNLYDYPCNQFVATFIGTPQMNLFNAVLGKEGKNLTVSFGTSKIELPESISKKLIDDSYIGKEVVFGVRPEDIHDEEIFVSASPKTCIDVEIDVLENLGNETILYTKVEGKEDYCIAKVDARTTVKAGDTVKLAIDANHVHLFDKDTELAILTLPLYNYYNVALSQEGNDLIATVDGNAIRLPEVAANLTNSALIGGEVLLGVNPSKVSLNREDLVTYVAAPVEAPAAPAEGEVVAEAPVEMVALEGELIQSMTGVVDFVEENNAYKVVYAKMPGKSAFSAIKAPLSTELNKGDEITVWFKEDALNLFDPTTGERIISYGEVPAFNKCATAVVENTNKLGETQLEVVFAGAKFKLPAIKKLAAPVTSAVAAIAPSAFVYTKEALKNKPSFRVRITNVDRLGDNMVVYAVTDAGLPVVARLDAAFKGVPGEKVKLGFDPFEVDLQDESGVSLLAAIEEIVAE
jgi:multiple sugar transport system ATP-binding protein